MEVSLRGSFIYLLHGLSLRVQTAEITAQERSQDVTDLDAVGRPMGDLLWLTSTVTVRRPKTQSPSRLERTSCSSPATDKILTSLPDWLGLIFWDWKPGHCRKMQCWRRVGVTFSDPVEEFGPEMLLFHFCLWRLRRQKLRFRLWPGLPNIHFVWQSQLTAWPPASSGAAWEGSWWHISNCHCSSRHMGQPQPIPPLQCGWEVIVRKDKQFHPKRKDTVLFPDSLSTKILHATVPFKPAPIAKLPQNFLPGQAGVSPLESSSQSQAINMQIGMITDIICHTNKNWKSVINTNQDVYACVHELKLKPLLPFSPSSKSKYSLFHKYTLCKLPNNTMRKAVSNCLNFLYDTSGSILNAVLLSVNIGALKLLSQNNI